MMRRGEGRIFRDAVISCATGEPVTIGMVQLWVATPPVRTVRGCIEWPFGVSASGGYGTLADAGGEYGTDIVTRQVLLAVIGEPPEPPVGQRILALHSCDNPPCIAPEHLRWGTEADNVDDKMKRGRHHSSRGTTNPRALITEEQVHEIDALLAAGVSQLKIAKEYGIAQTAVSAILRRTNWSHITPRVELPNPKVRRRGPSAEIDSR